MMSDASEATSWNNGNHSSQIGYSVLKENFHLPISQVAKDLGVCATVLKKICRKNGIPRWPHRKIKSLNKMISVLEQSEPATEEERATKESELNALRKQKSEIMDNPRIIGPTYSHINTRSPGKASFSTTSFRNNIRASSPTAALREQTVLAILHSQQTKTALSSSSPNVPVSSSQSVITHHQPITFQVNMESSPGKAQNPVETASGNINYTFHHQTSDSPVNQSKMFSSKPPIWATPTTPQRLAPTQLEFHSTNSSFSCIQPQSYSLFSNEASGLDNNGGNNNNNSNNTNNPVNSINSNDHGTFEAPSIAPQLFTCFSVKPIPAKQSMPQNAYAFSGSMKLPPPGYHIVQQPSRSLSSPSQYALNRNVARTVPVPQSALENKLPELNNFQEPQQPLDPSSFISRIPVGQLSRDQDIVKTEVKIESSTETKVEGSFLPGSFPPNNDETRVDDKDQAENEDDDEKQQQLQTNDISLFTASVQ